MKTDDVKKRIIKSSLILIEITPLSLPPLYLDHYMSALRIAHIVLFICVLILNISDALGLSVESRRGFFFKSTATILSTSTAAVTNNPQVANGAASGPSLNFAESKSGIQWADAKVGTGPYLKTGSTASIDYVLSTTGARYGSSIYKTADKGAPYRWTLGDGTTIVGLEEAIVGGEGITPMQPGGIRRVIIPPNLAYEKLAVLSEDCGQKGTNGPVPPLPDAFEEFQRFKNLYCNPNRAYQPDVVIDIKLYGKRSMN